MPKVNLYILDKLFRRMQTRKELNWSAIGQHAFETAIANTELHDLEFGESLLTSC
jgi:hypothetical protein